MQSSSQIIDNLDQNIGEIIKGNLTKSESIRFAVGYLFLSGLKDIYKELSELKEIKILIGNKTDKSTSHLLGTLFEKKDLQTPAEKQKIKHEASLDYSNDIGKEFRQNEQDKDFLNVLYELVKDEHRFQIKIYTKGTFHAKAYIFGAGEKSMTKGQCIVGSSNLSKSGFYDNTELNVIIDGNENYEKMYQWFTRLWDESEDFNENLLDIINQSWLKSEPTPYEVYMKVLYELVGEFVEHKISKYDWMETLFQFQIDAVYQAVGIVKKYGGVFLSDVVGLGKTYTGGIILHLLTRESHTKGLIIAPAGLKDNWKDAVNMFGINANVVSQDSLEKIVSDKNYDKFKYVLVDESHKFKDKGSHRYVLLQEFIHKTNKQLILLSATPLNLNGWDIYNQIKLFHRGEETKLPITPNHLYKFFKHYEKGKADISDIMKELMVRRTRLQIKTDYAEDLKRNNLAFPERIGPEIIHYDLNKEYASIYSEIESILGKRSPYGNMTPKEKRYIKDQLTREEIKLIEGKLNYAIYFKTHYLIDECFETDDNGFKKLSDPEFYDLSGVGDNLKELAKIMFFMRIESSPRAFLNTLNKILRYNELFLDNLKKGMILKTKHSDELEFYYSVFQEMDEEDDYFDILESGSYYDASKFKIEAYKRDIEEDIELLKGLKEKSLILTEIENIKIEKLKSVLGKHAKEKILIFSQFSDTAWYLGETLNNYLGKNIEVLTGGDKSNLHNTLGRFSPKSQNYHLKKSELAIDFLIATDVIAEGQNIQDASVVINYDLHWNPVRLIQRIGRIDRIGSLNDQIYIYNFSPSNTGESKIGMEAKVSDRIKEIHKHIGEENKILTKDEQLNKKMLELFEDMNRGNIGAYEQMEELTEEGNRYFTYSSFIKELRKLKEENPEWYEKIKKLPLRVRTAKNGKEKQSLVFCKHGIYEYFYIRNQMGTIENSKNLFLSLLKSQINEKRLNLPDDHDAITDDIENYFYQEIEDTQRESEYEREKKIDMDIGALRNKIIEYKEKYIGKYEYELQDRCEEIIAFLSERMEAYEKRKFKPFKKFRKPQEFTPETIEAMYEEIGKIKKNVSHKKTDSQGEKLIVISESIIIE